MPKQYPPRTHKVAALASSHLAELAELIESEGKKEAKLSDVLYEVAAQIDVMFRLRTEHIPLGDWRGAVRQNSEQWREAHRSESMLTSDKSSAQTDSSANAT